jgi:hypothetical protein
MEISGGGCPAISTRPALQVATAEGSEIVLTNPSEEWRRMQSAANPSLGQKFPLTGKFTGNFMDFSHETSRGKAPISIISRCLEVTRGSYIE